jgi:hypothetical protein
MGNVPAGPIGNEPAGPIGYEGHIPSGCDGYIPSGGHWLPGVLRHGLRPYGGRA